MISNDTVSCETVADTRLAVRALPALQQPGWALHRDRDEALSILERSVPLVTESEVIELKDQLGRVAAGHALVLQAGDCAEPIADTDSETVGSKVRALRTMSLVLEERTHRPVVRIGRIAGQYAKPRSQTHETVGGSSIPTYRGALVNHPFPSVRARAHEPQRLLRAHTAAETITRQLRCLAPEQVWTSHEALVLDYELPQVRPTSDGRAMLSSAHTVWIGARTAQRDHAHIALAARVTNPVGLKVSPTTTPADLAAIVETVDPDREHGRLMLIARMGSRVDRLPGLMEAIKRKGHPVIWMCDPMHANTMTAADGRKTRYLDAVAAELVAFQRAARSAEVVAGGVHLETTVDDVRECLRDPLDQRDAGDRYTTLCDPRLTTEQAAEVLAHWEAAA